ncbi:hypothetical protein HK100_003668, partial [Physocladia obscura]
MDKVRESGSSDYLRAVCANSEGSTVTPNTTRATNTPSVTNHHFNATLDCEQTAREAQSEILGDRLEHAIVGEVIRSDASFWEKVESGLDHENKELKIVNLNGNHPAEMVSQDIRNDRNNYDQQTDSGFYNRQQFEFKRLAEEIPGGHRDKQRLYEGSLPGFHSIGFDVIHSKSNNGWSSGDVRFERQNTRNNEQETDSSSHSIYDRVAQTYIPANSVTVTALTAPQAEREVTPAENEDYIVGETYFGYIEDQADALAVIEATIAKILVPFTGSSVDMSQFKVRSGSVAVIPESCRFVKRWRDGLKWSPSRAYGPFLLYRQIEAVKEKASPSEKLHGPSAIPGVEPLFTSKTLKAGTQIVDNGLTKRSISMKGSDGQRYRVISYYTPRDVIEMHKQTSIWRNAKQNSSNYATVLASTGCKIFRKAFHDAQFAQMIESREFAALLEKNISGYNVKANITTESATYPSEQPQSFDSNHQQNYISKQKYDERLCGNGILNSRITPPATASNYLSKNDEEYYAKIYEPYGYNDYYPYSAGNGYFHHQQFEKQCTQPFDRHQRDYQKAPLQYSRN